MAYDAPTRDQFKAAYPEFEDVDDTLIDNALTRAGRNVDTTWFEEDYQTGYMLYAAHLLQRGENAADTGGQTGNIASESLGRISVSYQKNANAFDASGLGSTSYGEEYLTLLKLNRGGPRLV
jgi:Protein of unknown function (DUF4054)